jgi:hypothetical protein
LRAWLALAVLLASTSAHAQLRGAPNNAPVYPIALWMDLSPLSSVTGYSTVAGAAKARNFTIIYGITGTAGGANQWPEHFGVDNGELAAIKANNLFLIAGVHLPFSAATEAVPITSGSYNSGTGQVTLTLSALPYIPVLGNTSPFDISGATGTGSFALADGPQVAQTGTTGTTVVFSIGTGHPATTITGGNLIMPGSVSSAVAVANSIGAQNTLIGYAPEDEPPIGASCAANYALFKPITFAAIPSVVAYNATQDPTRPTYLNHTNWIYGNSAFPCTSDAAAAMQAVAVASFDNFPVAHVIRNQYITLSDFLTTPNDQAWIEEENVQALLQKAGAGQPVWSYVEGGGDNLVSGTVNTQAAGVTNGSNVLVNDFFGLSAWNSTQIYNQFTNAWVGLTVTDSLGYIPGGTTITSVTDANHLVMSANATTSTCVPGELPIAFTSGSPNISIDNSGVTLPATCGTFTGGSYAFQPIVSPGCILAGTTLHGSPTSTTAVMSTNATCTGTAYAIAKGQSETITISGGVSTGGGNTGDCLATLNLCVVNGNEYRAKPSEVNAEVWLSLIAGASGIEYFVDDVTSYMFGLGDGSDPAAAGYGLNTAYVNGTVLNYARILKAATIDACSLRALTALNPATIVISSSCTGPNSILTVASSAPALAMLKSYGGVKYLFAMSSIRGSNTSVTFTIPGATLATLVTDSNAQYDPPNAVAPGTTFPLTSGSFSDMFGANGDDYQVKVYTIQ